MKPRALALGALYLATTGLLACATLAPVDREAIGHSMRLDAYAYQHCGDAGALCELVRGAYCSDRGIARRAGVLPDGGPDSGPRCEP